MPLVTISVYVGKVMCGVACICTLQITPIHHCSLSLHFETVVPRGACVCVCVWVSVIALELVFLASTAGDAVEDWMPQDITSLLIS